MITQLVLEDGWVGLAVGPTTETGWPSGRDRCDRCRRAEPILEATAFQGDRGYGYQRFFVAPGATNSAAAVGVEPLRPILCIVQLGLGRFPVFAAIAGRAAARLPDFIGPAGDFFVGNDRLVVFIVPPMCRPSWRTQFDPWNCRVMGAIAPQFAETSQEKFGRRGVCEAPVTRGTPRAPAGFLGVPRNDRLTRTNWPRPKFT